MNTTELHIHTCYSDGEVNHEGLSNLIRKNKLEVVSVTDHDSIEFYKKTSPIECIKRIAGIELTSKYHDTYLHILGYHINLQNSSLNQYLSEYQSAQSLRTIRFMREIKKMHLPTKFEQAILKKRIRRSQIKQAIELHNIDPSIYDSIDKIIAFIENSQEVLSVYNCVKLIHDAGGVSFLAHPGLYYQNSTSIEKFLNDVHVDGIECYTPHHNNHFTNTCVKLAEKRSLLISGGSDYHGGEYVRPLPFSSHSLALTNSSRLESIK